MTSIRCCIEHQLNEIELIRCCYSSGEEFSLDDVEALSEAKDFLDGKIENPTRNLSFILKIRFDERKSGVELKIVYPFHYPSACVEVHLRTYLSRESDEKFHRALKTFLEQKINAEEPYLMEFFSWLQDQSDLFIENPISPNKQSESKKKTIVYVRLWIYSHHIFSSEKRKNIVNWAQQLNLNGFSLPGKPGIICVEGDESDAEQYWTRLRNLNWKKLQIKEKQFIEIENEKVQFRFHCFEELNFMQNDHSSKGDFGQLYQYLQEKQLERIFSIYFGVDGSEKK